LAIFLVAHFLFNVSISAAILFGSFQIHANSVDCLLLKS
jgi:hypothetical protein